MTNEAWDQTSIIEAGRLYKMKIEVLASTQWLTEQQIAAASGAEINTSKWERERRIFTINIGNVLDGAEYLPRYALDPKNVDSPLKVIKEILCIFEHLRAGWELAYWFASVNSFLNEKRPLDLLITNPRHVVAAAADERDGIGFLSRPLNVSALQLGENSSGRK